MLSSSADELASTTLSSLALARGLLCFFKILKCKNRFMEARDFVEPRFESFNGKGALNFQDLEFKVFGLTQFSDLLNDYSL